MAELASPGARDIGMLDVVLDSVIAPSGLACYTGNLFPPWQGPLLVGGGDPGSANVCRWPS
jgi:glucose/arabinose dehydrogenase